MKERTRKGQFRATESIAYKKKMKNHFGQFEGVAEEAFMEAALEKYDFKQCARQDGTIYGVSDKNSCSQKGSKEVKADKGGEGGGQLSAATSRKLVEPASQGSESAKKGYTDKLDKMGTQALTDRITNYIGKGQGKSATDLGSPLDTANPKGTQFVITECFDRINKIRKEEGKEPATLTSIVDGIDLQRLGIDPDKANTLTKQGKSIKGAIKDPSNKGDVARLAPKTKDDYKRKPQILEGNDSQPA